jgi:short chain dehydrogenase
MAGVCALICRMSPQPDYGYDSYRGSGKLLDKVVQSNNLGSNCVCSRMTPLLGHVCVLACSAISMDDSCVTTVMGAKQVALITGADSGIGRAVALAFAREGADIAIAYLNEHEDAEVRTAHVSVLLLFLHAPLVPALGVHAQTTQPEHRRRQGALWKRQAAKRCCCPATYLRKQHARLVLQHVANRQGFDTCTATKRWFGV